MPRPYARIRLNDPQGRGLDYLRLAVTDRCNLRCRYCMPAEGIDLVPKPEILTLEELLHLARVFTELGVTRIRVTGGEPLVRRGVTTLLEGLVALPSRPEVVMTTNGLLLGEHLDAIEAAGLERLNLSLDTLNAANWHRITRRDGFQRVIRAMIDVMARGLGLKINVVMMPGRNDHELPAFVGLTRDLPLTVRFIEPMPFNGAGQRLEATITGAEILEKLQREFSLEPALQDPRAVGRLYAIPGHAGRVGIIAGHSRTFCGTCNRLRLNARGHLRTCLYGSPAADLGALMRRGAGDAELGAAIVAAVARRHPDGKTAERHNPASDLGSMADIGG